MLPVRLARDVFCVIICFQEVHHANRQMGRPARFLEILGLDEEPIGIFYSDQPPPEGLSPKETDLPTREKEMKGEIDWGAVFGNFSCVIGHIWRARRKRTTAWFSAGRFGCPGGAFYSGFLKPQTETIVHYVSSGFPGHMEGEFYLSTPDECRAVFEYMDPPSAPRPYMIAKPLGLFSEDETPELVIFFCRPESLAGLHQLATFVTGKAEVVRSPFGAACSGIVSWPRRYLEQDQDVAVVGGWDPSARKFYKTDELSFALSLSMFERMLEKWPGSFLSGKTWKTSRQKIERSRKAWKEA